MLKSPLTADDLAALLQKVARSDKVAFATLYEATSAKLFGAALRILRRRDLAEDVLQDVYVTIMQKAGTYDPSKGSAIAWMVTIVRNRSLDIVRRAAPVTVSDASPVEDVADEDPSALALLTQAEDAKQLLNCLDALEPQRKEMVVLAYFHGESREALGQRFDCPVGTIKTWLHRSLGQLRECMNQ